MKNPWKALPTNAPFVLDSDFSYVETYNSLITNDALRINTDLIPEPFLGNPNAKLVVLLLNPGVGDDCEQLHRQADFIEALRTSFTSSSTSNHFYLTDQFEGPGYVWWSRACNALKEIKTLPEKIFSIEFSPYHSKTFGHGWLRMPSQDYSFHLVRQAIKRESVIVCMRGEKYWLGAIPELHQYKNFLKVKNPRSASISSNNIHNFNIVLDVLNDT